MISLASFLNELWPFKWSYLLAAIMVSLEIYQHCSLSGEVAPKKCWAIINTTLFIHLIHIDFTVKMTEKLKKVIKVPRSLCSSFYYIATLKNDTRPTKIHRVFRTYKTLVLTFKVIKIGQSGQKIRAQRAIYTYCDF